MKALDYIKGLFKPAPAAQSPKPRQRSEDFAAVYREVLDPENLWLNAVWHDTEKDEKRPCQITQLQCGVYVAHCLSQYLIFNKDYEVYDGFWVQDKDKVHPMVNAFGAQYVTDERTNGPTLMVQWAPYVEGRILTKM